MRYSQIVNTNSDYHLTAAGGIVPDFAIRRTWDPGPVLIHVHAQVISDAAGATTIQLIPAIDDVVPAFFRYKNHLPDGEIITANFTYLHTMTEGLHTISLWAFAAVDNRATIPGAEAFLTVIQLPRWDSDITILNLENA